MRIPRLSFPGSLPKPAPFETVPLDFLQSRHGLKALRLSPGRVIELAGPWGLAPAEVVESGQKGGRPILLVRLTGPFIAAPLDGPTLALALVKGPRFDWAVEKASELGAAKLVPLLTARTASSSVAGEAKRSRWERLSEEARKQCGRVSPMEVAEPLALMEFLESGPPGPRLLLDYDGHGFPDGRGGAGTLLIGPEGGLSQEEKEAAAERGFSLASLGPFRLKSETAALAALARWADPAKSREDPA